MENNVRCEIAKVAYELYEKRGKIPGYDVQDWHEAEAIVLARSRKAAPKEKAKKPSRTAKKRK